MIGRRSLFQPQAVVPLALISAVCWISAATANDAESPGDVAREIIEKTGIKGGLIVHVGCGDARLTTSLHAGERYLVHGLGSDAADIERAREHIRSIGLSSKVWVQHWMGDRLPYAENMVNLVVASGGCQVTDEEIARVLAPNGVALFLNRQSAIENRKWVKPWPDEIDEWTHWLHGADGNAVAQDTVVGPPRRLQWIAKPFWSRHHNTAPSVTGIVSAQGRLFYIVDEAPSSMDGSAPDKWVLVARDAFNGLLLWRKPIPQWGWKTWSAEWTCRFTVPTHIPRRLVAVGDRVYVTLGFNAPLTELDAATGEVRRTFEGTDLTDEILCHEGRLIVTLNKASQQPGGASADRRGEADESPVRKWVAAIDVESGRMLWKVGDYVGLRSKTGSMDRISHLSMCAGDGQVFFVDDDQIVSLDLQDGHEVWRAARPEVPENKIRYNIRITDMCSLVYHGGYLFFAQLNPDRHIDWREIRGRLHTFDARNGSELWNRPCASWGWGHPADVFVVDGLVWVHDYQGGPRSAREARPRSAADLATGKSWVGSKSTFVVGLDPATGDTRRKISNFKAFNDGHHHRCYRNKATPRFMMTSYRGLEFLPWNGDESQLNHWVRGTCRLGAIPCNGMVYATPHPCNCYISSKLNGFVALAPEGQRPEVGGQRSERLVKGSVYGQIGNRKPAIENPHDWPMYRHDAERSGTTPSPLQANLKKAWEANVGGKSTSCVVVGDTVVLANVDSHEVLAFDVSDGKPKWRFTADGRVDTPPTVYQGQAFFGCADGCVYNVRLSDGQLVWRFRGAPEQRLVGALDGIESAWPIHGSVLVRNGVVYFAAGRSSFLDGGILACSLDARTGDVLSEEWLATPHSIEVDIGRNPLADTGLLSDILVSHGDSIFMRRRQVFPSKESQDSGGPLRSTSGLLDDSWFSRTRWLLNDKPYAEYFVFDTDSVYGVGARDSASDNGGFFAPGSRGYELLAVGRASTAPSGDQPNAKPSSKKKTSQKRWSIRVPLRVTSLVLAGETLFAAGTPDVVDPNEPWAAYEGERGGVLLAIASDDGQILAEHKLDSPPVFDGLTAANARLFVTALDGKVLCFQGNPPSP